MKNKIHIYELESYKTATKEQLDKLSVSPKRYFSLEGLPSRNIRELLEAFVWERGKTLSLSSLVTELIYYNNMREFLIERQIKDLQSRNAKEIIRMLKGWMLEKGYILTSKKYYAAYEKTRHEKSGIEKHMLMLLKLAKVDEREEQEKDIWDISKFDFPLQVNPIKNVKTINFTRISQSGIREEVKKVAYVHLKDFAVSSVLQEITATNRFTRYLKKEYPQIKSLLALEREHIENYLIHLQTEVHERKNYRTDLYHLRHVIEDVGNLYAQPIMKELFLSNDFPSTPRYQFKFYTDAEIKRINAHILNMDEQIARALFIHQLLGTRISDTFTLKTDCLRVKENRYFIRIEQVKSVTYEKAISNELARLILKAISYTKEHYGKTEYIFVNKKDPTKPYQYGMIQKQVMKMIRQENIRDDHGELLQFGTHIYRHCYGKKLTEIHAEDWMIARLLGHKTTQSVRHYRSIGNQMMADETRASREKMDVILINIIKGWDGYEI